MRPTRLGLFALLATVGLVSVACGSGGPAPTTSGGAASSAPAAGKPTVGGTVTFVLENDVIDFDPLKSRAFVDRNVHYQIYDSLVRIDETGKIIPWLATKWDTSADGKSVTLTLRDDVTYHDGSKFDAESVKWNLERYIKTTGSARAGELAPVDTIEAPNATTVKINLKAPFSPLLAQLVDRAGMMVSKKAFDAVGNPDDFTRKAFKAGTGPFMLTEAVKDDHMTLEKNPNWWGKDKDGTKLPYLDKITIKPIVNSDVRFTNMRTGDAQVANNISGKDVPTARSESSLNYQEKPALSFRSLIPNRAPGFVFNDKRYVKAVSMALDRKELLEKGYFNLGAVGYGTIAPAHFAYDPNFKPFEKADVDGAKKLIQEVGKPLSFELMITANSPVDLTLAQLIQAQLKKADITAEIVQLEFAKILELQSAHTFKGLTFVGWSGRIDPDGNTYDHIYSKRPFNDSSYSNADVDKALDEQRASSDQEKRKAALRKAEQIYVVDDPARIWLGFGAAQLLTNKKVSAPPVYPDQIIRFQFMSMAAK
jgi:peptide/nickel transport system substrate-binding protein